MYIWSSIGLGWSHETNKEAVPRWVQISNGTWHLFLAIWNRLIAFGPISVGPPYRFTMCVKFFPTEPQKLRDEFTRYLYVLQLRKQLEKGTLDCPDDQLAAELAAYLLQGRVNHTNFLNLIYYNFWNITKNVYFMDIYCVFCVVFLMIQNNPIASILLK